MIFALILAAQAVDGEGTAVADPFAPARSGLIEFMPETSELNCFQAICKINGTPYQRMMSRTVDPAVHNIEVDIAQVVHQVRQTLALTH